MLPNTLPTFVYLASQSPRRRQLLEQLGVPYELLLPDAENDQEEDAEALEVVRSGEGPQAYVQRVTDLKLDAALARHARRNLPAAPIVCSDTTVALGRDILGKPADADEARAMLHRLSGRSHRVLTAVAMQWSTQRHLVLSVSKVQFARWSDAQINAYVASGEPMGKAGAYGIQGKAAAYVENIRGSYSGIMGLPLFETGQLLQLAGFKV